MPTDPPAPRVNVGYVLDQLRRAVKALVHRPDPAAETRAEEKVARWHAVLDGLLTGSLQVGSRTPLAEIPPWVTLGVVKGGFATGQLLAAGPLTPHERERLATLPEPAEPLPERSRLNAWFLGDEGRHALEEMLRGGGYRIRVPEEGALLTVTWLLGRGESQRALALLETLAPLTDRLRFYPTPDPHPLSTDGLVHLRTVGDTVERLERVEPHERVARMNETLRHWNPLLDRAVALFLETVDGEQPRLAVEADGSLVRRPDGQGRVEGGWPCRHWPEDWPVRARQWVKDFQAVRREHPPKSNLARLSGFMVRCATDARTLTGRDVGALRKILASHVTRHGAPDSPRLRRVREAQAAQAARPLHHRFAVELAERLRAFPADEGLAALESVAAPVEGAPVPAHLLAKLEPCVDAPVERLVERGVIGSGEVLAQVLPQLTATVDAADFEDPDLRRLSSAMYAAFRRRRSLLLLDLERQVRFDELPWVAALRPFRQGTRDARELARRTLERVATLAITGYPQTSLPNKLVTELAALSKTAELRLPWVRELAADIFMQTFAPVYVESARVAARLLRGTLYARYYALPDEQVFAEMKHEEQWGQTCVPEFAWMCARRAGVRLGEGPTAVNGMVIEQAQILTTHNLAVLFESLELARGLRASLPHLALRCWRWMLQSPWTATDDFALARLRLKDAAQAWRQLVFFLSFVEESEVREFLGQARALLDGKDPPFVRHLQSVLEGLTTVLEGRVPPGTKGVPRPFLGWFNGTSEWMSKR